MDDLMIWILAKKDLRVVVRDARALIILLAMPLIFILVLGVSLGEGFGQKPADKLRVSVVNLDEGLPRYFDRPAMVRDGMSWFAITPGLVQGGDGLAPAFGAAAQSMVNHRAWFPNEPWSQLVLRDLSETANIRVEMIANLDEAKELVRSGRRAAVLKLGPAFSKRVERCSFLATGWRDRILQTCAFPRQGDPVLLALAAFFEENQTVLPLYLEDGLNPFYRDGIRLETLDVEIIPDPTQQTAVAIIDQVAQGTMLRIVMPWMIGRAFEKIGDPAFLSILGQEEQLPGMVKTFLTSPLVPEQQKRALSTGLQGALQNIFPKYNLTAKTWAALTKELERHGGGAETARYSEEGAGWLKRGAIRYQLLVPSYLVMFAFFLV